MLLILDIQTRNTPEQSIQTPAHNTQEQSTQTENVQILPITRLQQSVPVQAFVPVHGRNLQGYLRGDAFILNDDEAKKQLASMQNTPPRLESDNNYSGLGSVEDLQDIIHLGTRGPFANWCLLCCIISDKYTPHRDNRTHQTVYNQNTYGKRK
jgi:hypothetical protein